MGKYAALNIYLTLLRVAGGVIVLGAITVAVAFLSRFSFAQYDYIPPSYIYFGTGITTFILIILGVGLFALADVFQAIIDTADSTSELVDLMRRERK